MKLQLRSSCQRIVLAGLFLAVSANFAWSQNQSSVYGKFRYCRASIENIGYGMKSEIFQRLKKSSYKMEFISIVTPDIKIEFSPLSVSNRVIVFSVVRKNEKSFTMNIEWDMDSVLEFEKKYRQDVVCGLQAKNFEQ